MRSLTITGIAAILLGFGLSGAAAQPVSTAPADIPGAFDTLSPGNRSIAESLYNAQTGPTLWTRDQIATAKVSGDGWGQIFQEMKRDGLITDKSLGQVIRRDVNAPAAIHRPAGTVSSQPRRGVTVTTGSGASRVVGHHGAMGGRGHGMANPATGKGSYASSSSALGGALMAKTSGGRGGGNGNGGGRPGR